MLVSHDPIDVLSWADEIFVLHEGNIIQKGEAAEIYYHPQNEYVAGLFGAYNLINADSLEIKKAWDLLNEEGMLMIRPENILVSENTTNSVKAVIKKITFCGNYTSVAVGTDEQDLLIQSKNNLLNVGDEVFLARG